jgi:hypothetical protein
LSPTPGFLELDGLDPSGTGTRVFRIEKSFVQYFYKRSQLDKFHELALVKEILQNPGAIFQGLRTEQEEGFCYAGLASCAFSVRGIQIPPPTGYTFLVFVSTIDQIFQWRWEIAEHNLVFPIAHETRFERRVWPKV